MGTYLHTLALKNIPQALRHLRAWVFWRREFHDGRWIKVPYTAMGYKADVNNSEHWSSLSHLLAILRQHPDFADGIGYVLHGGGRLCALDLDRALTDAGTVKLWAWPLLRQFANTWCELSPSGGGLHIWCLAEIPHALKQELPDGGIEIYATRRYMTVTGHRFGDAPLDIADHQADVTALLEYYRPAASLTPAATIPALIPQSRRYPTMLSIAGTLARRGVCDQAIPACLVTMAEHQFELAKTPSELSTDLKKIMASVARWR
jgi:hypothetical protein